jgi:carbohydrate kinase (thermoresistant glucokinase family)
MAAGIALTDADRQGWLRQVAHCLASPAAAARGVVVSCSALKRSYRDGLRAAAPGVRFVHLHGARALLEQRMHARAGHYMPASLLQSQLDTLEPPAPDEAAITLDIAEPAERLAQRAARWIGAGNTTWQEGAA